MNFEVIIDASFLDVTSDKKLSPADKKHVVGLINDFEDGKWRHKKFQSFIWDNIAETALSKRERDSLAMQPLSQLAAAAKSLRLTDKSDDIGQGSELAEIILYGIMKHHYGALPVVPKIFYKQNSQDNAKGADSVHIVIESGRDFSLWFGEAKFYKSIDDARLPSIVKSVGNSLQTDKLKKENSIITNVRDLDAMDIDEELKEKIKSALSNRASIDALKPKIHVPILLLHECSITKKAIELSASYIERIKEYHVTRATAYFKRQIDAIGNIFKYSEISFHLIIFPVPDKSEIISRFSMNVEHFKEQ